MPYYACAPNDIWSLGVVLVNLTCGRNPWRVASAKDSTFRAFMGNRDFLKTILPLSDELNEILGMIFEMDPTKRISLAELRFRILTCPRFNQDQPLCTEEYQPLSPQSTLSDGSMVSDSSDNSSIPSEPEVLAPVFECPVEIHQEGQTSIYSVDQVPVKQLVQPTQAMVFYPQYSIPPTSNNNILPQGCQQYQQPFYSNMAVPYHHGIY